METHWFLSRNKLFILSFVLNIVCMTELFLLAPGILWTMEGFTNKFLPSKVMSEDLNAGPLTFTKLITLFLPSGFLLN